MQIKKPSIITYKYASAAVNFFYKAMLICMLQSAFTSAIHRLECRRDAVFKATDKQKILTLSHRNVLAVVNATSLAKCSKQCTSRSQCRSFNFKKKGSNNCQMLDIDKRNSSGKIEHAPGWIHYDTVTMVSPRCRFVACNPGHRCIDTCSLANGYHCIDINECDSSPCKNGGTCSNGVNKYTCACVPWYTGPHCETALSCPSSYSWLNESDRAVSFYNRTALCDDKLAVGWYRFGGRAGVQMITSPPSDYDTNSRCRAHAPGWLDGTHPSTTDGEVQRRACFANGGNPCWTTMNIKVLNCASHFLYFLYPPSTCSARYCGNY